MNDSTLRAAIEHLRQEHARPGSKEGGYVFDEDAGAVLEYAVGTETSVEFDEETLSGPAGVCVLHSPPADSPANQHDWQRYTERLSVRRMIVVGPSRTYILKKPPGWQAAGLWRHSPFEDWEEHAVDIAVERGLSMERPPDAFQRQELEVQVNRRMAVQYRLEFQIEVSDEIH
jgi:hypothetical protein